MNCLQRQTAEKKTKANFAPPPSTKKKKNLFQLVITILVN